VFPVIHAENARVSFFIWVVRTLRFVWRFPAEVFHFAIETSGCFGKSYFIGAIPPVLPAFLPISLSFSNLPSITSPYFNAKGRIDICKVGVETHSLNFYSSIYRKRMNYPVLKILLPKKMLILRFCEAKKTKNAVVFNEPHPEYYVKTNIISKKKAKSKQYFEVSNLTPIEELIFWREYLIKMV